MSREWYTRRTPSWNSIFVLVTTMTAPICTHSSLRPSITAEKRGYERILSKTVLVQHTQYSGLPTFPSTTASSTMQERPPLTFYATLLSSTDDSINDPHLDPLAHKIHPSYPNSSSHNTAAGYPTTHLPLRTSSSAIFSPLDGSP